MARGNSNRVSAMGISDDQHARDGAVQRPAAGLDDFPDRIAPYRSPARAGGEAPAPARATPQVALCAQYARRDRAPAVAAPCRRHQPNFGYGGPVRLGQYVNTAPALS